MTETEKEHLKKVYTAYYSQIDFTKDFCEQNIKHTICKDLLEHIENEIIKLSEVDNDR